MVINEISTNKKHYPDLLLLADEQEDMIDRYLSRGRIKKKCVLMVEYQITVKDFRGNMCRKKRHIQHDIVSWLLTRMTKCRNYDGL